MAADRRSTRALSEAEPENPSLEQPQVALLPQQLLQPGEIIILLLKPSPWYILLSSLRSLAIIFLIYMLARSVQNDLYDWLGLGGRDLLILALAAAAARLFWGFLEWLSRVYVLTDRRVIRVKGVLRVYVFEAPLKKIQHTVVYVSLRERLFGLGTIGFTTAGTGGVEAYWLMVARPLEVHQKVVQTLHRYR